MVAWECGLASVGMVNLIKAQSSLHGPSHIESISSSEARYHHPPTHVTDGAATRVSGSWREGSWASTWAGFAWRVLRPAAHAFANVPADARPDVAIQLQL